MSNGTDPQEIVSQMVKGYGPDFPPLQTLFHMTPNQEYLTQMDQPIPALGRYRKSVNFLSGVTSGKVIGIIRFKVIIYYLIVLSGEMSRYEGEYRHQRIVGRISPADIDFLWHLGSRPEEIFQAEVIEKFSDHDTAAAVDYIKLKIAELLPHLAPYIEAVHFGNTSEDVMGNVFGVIGNMLVYGHFMPALCRFCDVAISFVDQYEQDGPLILPAFTHEQAAEPTSLGKKFITRLAAISYLIERMRTGDGKFIPFSGKLGGAVGNMTCHFAAYPDIDWWEYGRNFVESMQLTYHEFTDQCVPFVVEAQHFVTIGNILTQVLKLTDDFIKLARCPGQFFVKKKKIGEKGSSIMPNKSNAWGMEGAIEQLIEARERLFSLAIRLPSYPDEGNMGRSYLMRNIGAAFLPLFIGFDRILTGAAEMLKYIPNRDKIKVFLDEYPGMSGSSLQTVLKREGVRGDAYRTIQDISINPDGSYANSAQFKDGLEAKMESLGLGQPVRNELRGLLNPRDLVLPVHLKVRKGLENQKDLFRQYRQQAEQISNPFKKVMEEETQLVA